jgi:hypothetical protein
MKIESSCHYAEIPFIAQAGLMVNFNVNPSISLERRPPDPPGTAQHGRQDSQSGDLGE